MTKDDLLRTFCYADGVLRWRADTAPRSWRGDIAGNLNNTGYVVVGTQGKKYLAHRLIFLMHHGYMPDEVDHINGDRSDNRIENLRAVTRKQNQYNAGTRADNTSGVKGVFWYKQTQKWAAQCKFDGVLYPLGYFDKLSDAASAVRAFRQSNHGEFANHG